LHFIEVIAALGKISIGSVFKLGDDEAATVSCLLIAALP
jgi:hypothetical protein